MPALLMRHKVADDRTWKARFDADAPLRRAHGCIRERLFRTAADPNEVVLLLIWDDGERARLFAQSDALQEAMARSGVIDQPDWWVVEEIDTEGAQTT